MSLARLMSHTNLSRKIYDWRVDTFCLDVGIIKQRIECVTLSKLM